MLKRLSVFLCLVAIFMFALIVALYEFGAFNLNDKNGQVAYLNGKEVNQAIGDKYTRMQSENIKDRDVSTIHKSEQSKIVQIASQSEEEQKCIEEQILDETKKQLNELKLSEFEDFLNSLDSEQYVLFGETTFEQRVTDVLNGKFKDNSENFLNAILKIVMGEVMNFLPTLASIVLVSILSGLLTSMRPNFMSKGMGEVVYFVCYSVIILIMVNSAIQLMQISSKTMDLMKMQMNAFFPVILTLMAGVGGVVSVSVYQPAVAVLSTLVLNVITSVIFPIFIISMVLGITSNLSSNVKLNKLNDFFKSLSNWIIGVVFTVFLAFLSIQGITASTYDGVSIRAAKYAVSNSIPILGGYIKDGFDLIISSSVLIKNSIGVTGLILLLSTVALPIIKLVFFMMGLKITAAIVEPITDSRISTFISSTSKNMVMLIVSIIGVAFMYFITIMLLICSCNFF